MPTAAMSVAVRSALASAPAHTRRVFVQISAGSCSTQPARGRICRCSIWSLVTTRPEWSKTMHRVDVVPWSTAATYWLMPWNVVLRLRLLAPNGVAVCHGNYREVCEEEEGVSRYQRNPPACPYKWTSTDQGRQQMVAAIAMSALSLGAVLELALAAAIRSRAGRRRDAMTLDSASIESAAVDSATSAAATGAVNVTGR